MAGYGTDEGLTAYAAANGLTLPEGGNLAAARQRGSIYIDGVYGDRFPGSPAGGVGQERAWPRTGAADVYGNALPSDAVPQRIEWAAYEAAVAELSNPGSLSPSVTLGSLVKRRKVGPIEREFFEPQSANDMQPKLLAIDGILRPLLAPEASNGPAILVV